ncbi:MAG TPA: hypothetical protein VFR58_00130 [Flavisolibacter sp.]|nr:hypothetical protein [Flavisolibacter sp.]
MRICLSLFLLLAASLAGAQDFPASFLGHWEGELEWFQAGRPTPQKVKMQLIIKPADTAGQFTWQLIYGDKQQDNRPYLLKPVDTAKGHWVVDEQNGILLDQYWIGGRVTNAFTVQKTTIFNNYWLEGDKLMAEFYGYSSASVRRSGGTGEDIPPVDSYGAKSYQRAVLKRK